MLRRFRAQIGAVVRVEYKSMQGERHSHQALVCKIAFCGLAVKLFLVV